MPAHRRDGEGFASAELWSGRRRGADEPWNRSSQRSQGFQPSLDKLGGSHAWNWGVWMTSGLLCCISDLDELQQVRDQYANAPVMVRIWRRISEPKDDGYRRCM